MDEPILADTAWLAKKLSVSVKTIERLRAQKSTDIPPHVFVGGCLRYDTHQVTIWLESIRNSKSIEVDHHE